jgi:hypothetical protein
VIDKSDELSKLQRELGILAKIQEEYNKRAFELVEKKKLEAKEVKPVENDIFKPKSR